MNRNRIKHFVCINVIYSLTFFLFSCSHNSSTQNRNLVRLTDKIDPNIVLINIGNEDRQSIAKILLSIDSCRPILLGVDVWFPKEKNYLQDSTLSYAFKSIKNDIICYKFNTQLRPVHSVPQFLSFIDGEGYTEVELVNGMASKFFPQRRINNEAYESLALKIVKKWHPKFVYQFNPNEPISIRYERTLEQFVRLEGSRLKFDNFCDFFQGKVVLIGYFGPTPEDKYYTPIRTVISYPEDEPDTYGLVILANQIRTILEYEAK